MFPWLLRGWLDFREEVPGKTKGEIFAPGTMNHSGCVDMVEGVLPTDDVIRYTGFTSWFCAHCLCDPEELA